MADEAAFLELVSTRLARLRERYGAAACSLALADGGALVFVAAAGAGADEVVGLRIPVSQGIAGWSYVSGETVAVADVRADRRWDAATAEQTGYLPRTILATPVDDGASTLGVLEVLDRSRESESPAAAEEAARELALLLPLRQQTVRSLGPDRLGPGWADRLERLASASPGEQRLAARLLDALLDPEA